MIKKWMYGLLVALFMKCLPGKLCLMVKKLFWKLNEGYSFEEVENKILGVTAQSVEKLIEEF